MEATVIEIIKTYGYLALFFCLWLGIVGIPIPDEVVVMTGGFASSIGLLKTGPAFIVIYLGVISGLTIGYGLGRLFGKPILTRWRKNKRIRRHLLQATRLINKYGGRTLCISYCFPVVCHLVPYVVGFSKLPYPTYATYSYTTGLVWTLFFFLIGKIFGMYINEIGQAIHTYGLEALGAIVVIGLLAVLFQYLKKEKDSIV